MSTTDHAKEPLITKTKIDPAEMVDPTKILQRDNWLHILSFVGPGHFVFVAGVNRSLKEWYKDSFDTIEVPPMVFGIDLSRQEAKYSDTFCKAAVLSVSCAEYWNEDTRGNFRLAENSLCLIAAKYGKLEVLKWAKKHNFKWDSWTCFTAASNGHLECLKFAHENGCPWYEAICHQAAENGHLDCLKYAHNNGCQWNEWTCSAAATKGHLACLQYAHEKECPWDARTCTRAAKYGHLECLKYAHEKGCPWDAQTSTKATKYGHLECLQYARDNGCP